MLTFFAFEIRYWLRSWMLWIFLAVISLLIFGAVSSDKIIVGGALPNTNHNAPYIIQSYYAIMSLLTLLMTVAFVNSGASRDFSSNTYQIIFTTPLRKFDYLFGHYLGSALIAVIPMLGVSAGVLAGKYMPWVDPERWGPIDWAAHLNSILVFALPNTLFISAIIFAIAVVTRSTATSFIGGLLLLVAYVTTQSLTSDMKNEVLGALLDPFGLRTFSLATKYWTVADKNTLSLGYTGLVTANRAIWISVSALVFAFAYWRFRFEERSRKGKPAAAETPFSAGALPEVEYRSDFAAQLRQFFGCVTLEFFSLIRTTSFIVIVAAALLNSIPSLIFTASEGYGNSSLPVTYHMLETIAGTAYLFLVVIITYYSGVLIWKERDSGVDEVHDAAPFPNWVAFAAKFVTLLAVIELLQAVEMTAAILVQAFQGYHRHQIGLYASELLGIDFSLFAMLTFLAFFCHVVSPNKYIGYFSFVALLIVNTFVWQPLNVATRLLQFASTPDIRYSDFYGRAPFMEGWWWFTIYWLLFCGLLAVASILLWQRGRETQWEGRWRNAELRFNQPMRFVTGALTVAFVATGGWVYYNTLVLNKLTPPDDREILQADYEKTYKKYEHLPQPRVTAIQYAIDIYPEQRNLVLKGDQTIVNKTSGPIHELHLSVNNQFDTDVKIDGATLKQDDKRLFYRIYQLNPPMQAGETRRMQFTVKSNTRGFENSLTDRQLMPNGTFFNNTIAPQIGYQAAGELTTRNERKKRGLKEKDLMPALERNCTVHCMDTYLSNNSDWVSVRTVISTSPDQIAVAPGSLLREWNENGRRYFEYQLDHDSMNFYSFISARYQVAREEWNGVKVEVYYHPEHVWNVPKMLRSVKKSLEYYTQNFGPYAHKEARIIEFPRIASFAQAFPGTMPYSESIGFIANLKDPEDIDMVYYVVAHEMGHQWWAHQVIGAVMQGATLLSETMAQYSALMVMEHEYGRDQMRKFLQYEMDNYLRSRGRELLKERPLLRVEANQGYVHYRKGSVVMYYLKEIVGEEAINRALRKVIQQYAYAPPPYPTSYALEDALREETPEQYGYLLKDLFDEITLFSNRTLTATAKKRADGKFDVTIEVEAKKFKADDKGNETEVPLNDWIEIGAFAKPPKGKKYGKTLHRERVLMTQARNRYTFTVDELPDQAGIDPFAQLIDRVPKDNLKSVDVTN